MDTPSQPRLVFSHRAMRIAPALASAIASLLVYCVTLHGTFVYDDRPVVQNDPRLAPSRWHEYLTKPYLSGVDKLYRPLTSMSFAVERWLMGPGARSFHIVDWLLEALVAAMVAELAFRLAGTRVAWIAGLLFAVHPAHVEVVAGLVGRAEILNALATLCGLCLFLRGRLTAWRILLIDFCFILAALSKEQGILFPALILAAVPIRRSAPGAQTSRKAGQWLAASLCYLLAGYVFFREKVIGFTWDRIFLEWVMNPMVRSHGLDRLLMPLVLMGRYLVLLLAPHRQSIDYGAYAIGWIARRDDPYLYVGTCAVVVWIALCWWAVQYRRWPVFFCLIAFALTYGMIGNIVALIGTIFADRLIYLPSVFFLILIAIVLARLRAGVLAPLLAVLVALGSWSTVAYARLWNTPLVLFQQCLMNQPAAAIPYEAVYFEYKRQKDWMNAHRIAAEAVRAVPDSHWGYDFCIESDMALGDPADAWLAFNQGMKACSGFDRTLLVLSSSVLSNSSTKPAVSSTRPD